MDQAAMNHENLRFGDFVVIAIIGHAASVGCGGADGRYPVGVFTGEFAWCFRRSPETEYGIRCILVEAVGVSRL